MPVFKLTKHLTEQTMLNTQPPETQQFLITALEKTWRNYLTEFKRCRAEFSNETVHDFRVAVRRMLAMLQLLACLAPRPRLQKLTRTLKEQLDDLDDLRDVQVILAEISERIRELPDLNSFQKHLQIVESRLLRTLRKKLKHSDHRSQTKRMRKIHDLFRTIQREDWNTATLQAIDDVFLIARQRLESVNMDRPMTIHRIRIAFKTFRYMLEIIYPLVPDFPSSMLEQMHDYQAHLGEVQDAEIFIQTLTDFYENSSIFESEALYLYSETRLQQAVADYLTVSPQLRAFWRETSNSTFPWEHSI